MSDKRAGLTWSLRASFLLFPLLTAFAQVGLLPVLPQLSREFSSTPNAVMIVRFLVTGVGIAMIVGAPFAGLLSKRFGWRRSIIGAVLVFSLAGAGGAVLGNLWAIAVTRILVGLSAAVLGSLLMAILTLRLEAHERDRWIGYVVVSGTLGSLALIPLSGFMGSIDWRLPFVIHLAGLLALFAIVPGIEEPVPSSDPQVGKPGLARSKFPLWALGLGLMIGILVHGQNTFVPFHLADIGVGDPRAISFALVAAIPLVALTSILYAPLRRRLTMKAIFILSSAACALGFLTVGLGETLPVVIAGNILLGIGGGLFSPNMFAFVASRGAAEDRARDIGVVRGTFSAGPFVGQMGLEPVAAIASAGAAIASLCAVALVAAVVFGAAIKGGMRTQAPT